MSHEIEVKLKLSVQALIDAGLRLDVETPRHFEENWLLDNEVKQLGEKWSILRVRDAGGKGFLTFKGKSETNSQFKRREEIETELGNAQQALEIFARLGFTKWFHYQKYRTVYQAILPSGNHLHVMADETPIGDFLELEGEELNILEAVQCLKITPQSYILDSYLALQLAHCQVQGKALEDMIF